MNMPKEVDLSRNPVRVSSETKRSSKYADTVDWLDHILEPQAEVKSEDRNLNTSTTCVHKLTKERVLIHCDVALEARLRLEPFKRLGNVGLDVLFTFKDSIKFLRDSATLWVQCLCQTTFGITDRKGKVAIVICAPFESYSAIHINHSVAVLDDLVVTPRHELAPSALCDRSFVRKFPDE